MEMLKMETLQHKMCSFNWQKKQIPFQKENVYHFYAEWLFGAQYYQRPLK